MLAGILLPLAYDLLNRATGGANTPEEYRRRWEKAQARACEIVLGKGSKKAIRRVIQAAEKRSEQEPLLAQYGNKEANVSLYNDLLKSIDRPDELSIILCQIIMVLICCDERDDEEAILTLIFST
jgi:hypothetical protein